MSARDTGAIIAEELQLPFEVREGLHERETGEFAGKPYESIFEAEGAAVGLGSAGRRVLRAPRK